jgi:hypothetical protein
MRNPGFDERTLASVPRRNPHRGSWRDERLKEIAAAGKWSVDIPVEP